MAIGGFSVSSGARILSASPPRVDARDLRRGFFSRRARANLRVELRRSCAAALRRIAFS
jgi:hypothetical protein